MCDAFCSLHVLSVSCFKSGSVVLVKLFALGLSHLPGKFGALPGSAFSGMDLDVGMNSYSEQFQLLNIIRSSLPGVILRADGVLRMCVSLLRSLRTRPFCDPVVVRHPRPCLTEVNWQLESDRRTPFSRMPITSEAIYGMDICKKCILFLCKIDRDYLLFPSFPFLMLVVAFHHDAVYFFLDGPPAHTYLPSSSPPPPRHKI